MRQMQEVESSGKNEIRFYVFGISVFSIQRSL